MVKGCEFRIRSNGSQGSQVTDVQLDGQIVALNLPIRPQRVPKVFDGAASEFRVVNLE